MKHKIYLVRHLDSGMGYVGITSGDLKTRWWQHMHDKSSALYRALRDEGHRMTMMVIEECNTREEAMEREQYHIRAQKTMVPNGWNRRETSRRVTETSNRVRWVEKESPLLLVDGELKCPICWKNDGMVNGEFMHFDGDAYHPNGDDEITRFPVTCETCHGFCEDCTGRCRNGICDHPEMPPRPKYEIELWGTHGRIEMRMIVYVKDKS